MITSARGSYPSLPNGVEVAEYSTYDQAQQAVSKLGEEGFPIRYLTIVGRDLSRVEEITGRLSLAHVASTGFLNGAFLGLLAGVMVSFTVSPRWQVAVVPLAVALFAILNGLFQLIFYSLSGQKTGFRSRSAVVARRYILVANQQANWAKQLLGSPDFAAVRHPQEVTEDGGVTLLAQSGEPSQFGVRADEQPKFGVRLSEAQRKQLREDGRQVDSDGGQTSSQSDQSAEESESEAWDNPYMPR